MTRSVRPFVALMVAGLVALSISGCGKGNGSLQNSFSTSGKKAPTPPFHPENFHDSASITNPWFPIAVGTTWEWKGDDRGSPYQLDQWVPNDTRSIDGVVALGVMDKDTVSGQTIGGAVDYYAQDDFGNVWYLGEVTTHYVNGVLTDHADSWIAGVKGALPGIFMPAHPAMNSKPYQQEFAPNLAADVAVVTSIGPVCVPKQCYDNVVETHETTVLDPGVVAAKFYAPGAGLIKEKVLQGDPYNYELISFNPPGAGPTATAGASSTGATTSTTSTTDHAGSGSD